jgi:hypothetical protein
MGPVEESGDPMSGMGSSARSVHRFRSGWDRAARLVTGLVWIVVGVLGVVAACTGTVRDRPSGHPALTSVVAPHDTEPAAPADDGGAGRLALLAEVRRELATMRDSSYQHKTDVDAVEGAYNFDCSGFVAYALAHSRPAALAALPVTASTRPLARDFEHHFRAVAAGAAGGPWRAVGTVPALRPGDVIAWLTPPTSPSRNTGHVLVVLADPVRNPVRPDEWLVTVADSTTSPHADDSRDADTDGLGTGTIGLVVDGSERPIGYYWRGGVSTARQLTGVSLGRPT